MKTICFLLFVSVAVLRAETLFSPGSMTIGTNQVILITSMNDGGSAMMLDGQDVYFRHDVVDPQFAIAGNHVLSFDEAFHGNGFITYQLLNNSAIKTIILTNTGAYGTPFTASNSISVPAGKTIQFFSSIAWTPPTATIVPDGSTNTYNLPLYPGLTSAKYRFPAVSGPVTIQLACDVTSGPSVISFYFTDEILQVPPKGFLDIPAPALEIDIQKSYDLTNWTNTGAFGTSAEAKAFYRLQIVQ